MAFLDNSGDIILDAVLTEVGRKRLAEATRSGGNGAKVTAFSVGDDEINYSQYDLNNPSGSNYADLEILQTPILEAFTQANANINYGLLTLRENLLYMPALKVNELNSPNFPALTKYNNIFYIAANAVTYNTLIDTENLTSARVGNGYSPSAGNFIFVEGGLDTDEITKSAENKRSYLSNNVSNRGYTVGVDSRICSQPQTMTAGQFKNRIKDNADERMKFSVGATNPSSNVAAATANYRFYNSKAAQNEIYEPDTGGPVSKYTTIAGPGDTITCFQFLIKSNLRTDGTAGGTRDVLYTQIGSIDVSSTALFGSGARTYDYIDTVVYVSGMTTGARIDVPVRIIRRVS